MFDSKRPRMALAIINTFSLIHVVSAATTIHFLQYICFACLGFHRSALFGGTPQFLAYYFPPQQFGTLMGIATFCGGLMTGIEYPLTWTVVQYGQQQFRSVFWGMAVLTALWYVFPACFQENQGASGGTTETNGRDIDDVKLTEVCCTMDRNNSPHAV